jgi:8-amino-7-oxononanoate synthase
MESPPGPEIRLGERTLLYFGGTAYHALQGHPELLDAAAVAMQRYGMGTATAGTWPIAPSPVQRELELEAAAYFGTQDAVALASGYMTTWVALAGLEGRFERCFVDQNSHYAVMDALRLMGIEAVRYAHDDVDELASLLRAELRGQASQTERPLIVSDGVFPTFGRVAQLGRLAELAAEFGGLLWVDDAHGVGVLGEHGRGSSELAGLEIGEHVFVGASLAKAIGAHGGIVPGPAEFCARIRERSRLLSASMAISVPNAAAATAGLRILQREPGWRVELLENTRWLKDALRSQGLELLETPHPVTAFSLGTESANRRVHEEMLTRGLLVPRASYVGAGSDGVLRIVLCSQHRRDQVERLVNELGEAIAAVGGQRAERGRRDKRGRRTRRGD